MEQMRREFLYNRFSYLTMLQNIVHGFNTGNLDSMYLTMAIVEGMNQDLISYDYGTKLLAELDKRERCGRDGWK